MVKDIHGRIKQRFFPALAVVLGFILFGGYSVQADTPDENEDVVPKTGRITTHTPVHYIYDYSATGDRVSVEGSDVTYANWNQTPVLFPGDTVTIVPEVPDPAKPTKIGQAVTGYVGLYFNNDDPVGDVYPIKVTQTKVYGKEGVVSEDHRNEFIQGFEITGTEPVLICIGGGGGRYSETYYRSDLGGNVTVGYYASGIGFKYYPNYCRVVYEYADPNTGDALDDEFVKENIKYYSDAQDADALWDTDAVNNMIVGTNSEDAVSYSARHPYIEGLHISKIIIRRQGTVAYKIANSPVFDTDTDTMDIMPCWSGTNDRTGGDWTMKGSYTDDYCKVRFEFLPCRTVTMDACGGTINGFASRIYEASSVDKTNLVTMYDNGLLTPKREGYYFAGWYEDEAYTTPVTNFWTSVSKYSNSSTDRTECSCHLYAKWLKGWVEDGNIRYYYDENGPVTGWRTIEDNRYYFDEDGEMIRGWWAIGNKNFYFGDDGVVTTGLRKIVGTTYYFNQLGEMQTGWQTIGGKNYYFDEDGGMLTGLQTIGGKNYFFGTDGVMQTGWKPIGEKKYYFGTDGVMVTGKKKISGKWYYFGTGGALQKGLVQLQSKWYCFGDDGAMIIGWGKYKNKYYFGSKDQKNQGELQTGWLQDGNKWYFMSKDSKTRGQMMTGWVQDGKKWYFMSKDSKTLGQMMTGWLQDGKNWYFLKADGSMAANEYCKGYWLDSDGRWTYKRKASWKKDKTGWWFGDGKWYAKSCTLTIDGKKYSFNAKGYLK